MARKREENKGFVLRAEEWADFCEDSGGDDVKSMLEACITYFLTGEQTEFCDRGMRLFFRQQKRNIDYDGRRWAEKSANGTFAAYCRQCKEQGITPLPRDEWEAQYNNIADDPDRVPTIANDNDRTPTIAADNERNQLIEYNINQNNSNLIENKHSSSQQEKEASFEVKRQQALKMLEGMP